MSLGTILKDARERKGLTIADVAEQTHLLPQMVEEIEQDDFHRFAAAIYGRGFIRLYAECVGENPEPLVQEFSEIYSGARRPVIATRPVKTAQEDVKLVESSVFPSGRPRIKTRVVETAPEETEEKAPEKNKPEASVRVPDRDIPDVSGAKDKSPVVSSVSNASSETAGQGKMEAPESRGEQARGDLFHQADIAEPEKTESPADEKPVERHFHFFKRSDKNQKKRKTIVPFDPFVDEPTKNPVDGDTPLLPKWMHRISAFFQTLSPRVLAGGAVFGGVVVVLLIIWMVKPSSASKKEQAVSVNQEPENVVPAEINGRPSSFSVSLLPPPDSYVR